MARRSAKGAKKSVTLDDVARIAGVSRATASRSLNGRDGVRSDVRERVNLVANSLGYQPNRAAQQLASGRASLVGLVIPSDDLLIDSYSASLVHAVSRAVNSADLGLMLFLTNAEPGARALSGLRDGSIDGAIISVQAAGLRWVEELLTGSFPAVMIGTHPTRKDVQVVDTENRQSSRRIVEHLFDQGCRRIAAITGRTGRVDAENRLAGYRDALNARGLDVDEALIVQGDYSRQSGRDAAAKIAELGPDGVFACNDEMAIGVIDALERGGLVVPRDIAVAGFDGTKAGHLAGVSLTTCRQPLDQIATTALQELDRQISEGTASETPRHLEPELIIGESSQLGTDPSSI